MKISSNLEIFGAILATEIWQKKSIFKINNVKAVIWCQIEEYQQTLRCLMAFGEIIDFENLKDLFLEIPI